MNIIFVIFALLNLGQVDVFSNLSLLNFSKNISNCDKIEFSRIMESPVRYKGRKICGFGKLTQIKYGEEVFRYGIVSPEKDSKVQSEVILLETTYEEEDFLEKIQVGSDVFFQGNIYLDEECWKYAKNVETKCHPFSHPIELDNPVIFIIHTK